MVILYLLLNFTFLVHFRMYDFDRNGTMSFPGTILSFFGFVQMIKDQKKNKKGNHCINGSSSPPLVSCISTTTQDKPKACLYLLAFLSLYFHPLFFMQAITPLFASYASVSCSCFDSLFFCFFSFYNLNVFFSLSVLCHI